MRVFLLFLLVLVSLYSCQHDDSSTPNPYAAKILAQSNLGDTFLYERPKQDPNDSQMQKRALRYLKLESLEKGFDSIQIRIWYGCPLGPGELLVVLKSNKEKWGAEVCKIVYPATYQRWGDSITRIIFKDSPKSGWIKFINRLFDLSVLSLPDEKQLKNLHYSVPMDGCGVDIEIATKNVYRKYGYGNPDIYDAEFLEAKNILSILKLINEEFGIRGKFNVKYMWPDDGKNQYPKDSAQPPVEREIQLQDIKDSTAQGH